MKETKHTCTLARLHTYKRIHSYTYAHLNAYTPARMHALTLIELVIVIAIISVLLGIVWTGLSSVREKARQAQCISNLKQIAVAVAMYAHDYNGVQPTFGAYLSYWQLGLPPGVGTLWIAGYVKDFQILLCPSRFLDPNWDPVRDTWEGSPPKKPYYRHRYWSRNAIPTFPDGEPVLRPFEEIIAACPEWPVIICFAHGWFYRKRDKYWFISWRPEHRILSINTPYWDIRWWTVAEVEVKFAQGMARLKSKEWK